jgi:hypothetical protein
VGELGEDGATVRSPTFEERAAAPPPPEPSPPQRPVNVGGPSPAVVRAPEAVSITSLVQEIPAELREQMGKLPFKPPAPELAVARTMKVPVMNRYQGQTAPVRDNIIAKAGAAPPFVSDRENRSSANRRGHGAQMGYSDRAGTLFNSVDTGRNSGSVSSKFGDVVEGLAKAGSHTDL